jgi:hypothetical protein
MPTNHMSTHTVMPMGSHTSKPVMKYCLKLRCFMRWAIGGGQGLKKLNGKRMKRHSLQRWPSLQVLGYRWPAGVRVLRPHQLRCPLLQALRPRHHP